MLRITTNESPQALTLRLEGRLEGPWVAVLAECWSKSVDDLGGRRVRVDLNGLTFVDAAGKARLAEMYARGAELFGEDLETNALVAEIQTGRASDGEGDGEARQVGRDKPIANLAEQLTDLQRLRAELHEVNEELAKAARPLDRLAELTEEQRQHLATGIRAELARWESVTQRIAQVLRLATVQTAGNAEPHQGRSR
jgi:ABC-type transporter Mla MlaB component